MSNQRQIKKEQMKLETNKKGIDEIRGKLDSNLKKEQM